MGLPGPRLMQRQQQQQLCSKVLRVEFKSGPHGHKAHSHRADTHGAPWLMGVSWGGCGIA